MMNIYHTETSKVEKQHNNSNRNVIDINNEITSTNSHEHKSTKDNYDLNNLNQPWIQCKFSHCNFGKENRISKIASILQLAKYFIKSILWAASEYFSSVCEWI